MIIGRMGRDGALRRPRPEGAVEMCGCRRRSFRRLTLRSATGTAQRAIPTKVPFLFGNWYDMPNRNSLFLLTLPLSV